MLMILLNPPETFGKLLTYKIRVLDQFFNWKSKKNHLKFITCTLKHQCGCEKKIISSVAKVDIILILTLDCCTWAQSNSYHCNYYENKAKKIKNVKVMFNIWQLLCIWIRDAAIRMTETYDVEYVFDYAKTIWK